MFVVPGYLWKHLAHKLPSTQIYSGPLTMKIETALFSFAHPICSSVPNSQECPGKVCGSQVSH